MFHRKFIQDEYKLLETEKTLARETGIVDAYVALERLYIQTGREDLAMEIKRKAMQIRETLGQPKNNADS